jgi:hypothetical protein
MTWRMAGFPFRLIVYVAGSHGADTGDEENPFQQTMSLWGFVLACSEEFLDSTTLAVIAEARLPAAAVGMADF